MAIIVTDIITEYGAYYIANRANRERLKGAMLNGGQTLNTLRLVRTESTKYEGAINEINRVLQPFQKTWSPTGDVTFKPAPIDLFKVKVDMQFYPDDIESNWLGFLAGNNLDRKTWPLVRFLMEQNDSVMGSIGVLAAHNRDLEENEIFAGSFLAPPTPGTAGIAGTAMNGLKKVTNDWITASRITPINSGAWDTSTPTAFVNAIEAWVRQIPARFRKVAMTLRFNESYEALYRTGMLAKYNINYAQVPDNILATVREHPNIKIVGLPSFGTSQKVICTPDGNAVYAIKRPETMGQFRIENVDRLVKVYTDYYIGVGYLVPELVFTNDRDLS
jgi:hypothetical protein